MIHKRLHGKLKIEQQVPHKYRGWIKGPVLLVASVLLILVKNSVISQSMPVVISETDIP